tara:strand:- start:921 stop:1088 length:168 start_codon:yes stop_codon:yes gene_type:complete
MGLEKIIPLIALILILILILPSFIKSNFKEKVFFKNVGIWAIIVSVLMIILYLVY